MRRLSLSFQQEFSMYKRSLVLVIAVASCAVALLHAQSPPRAPRPGVPGMPPPPALGAPMQPTRVQIEFYQLTCTAAALADLDLDHVSQGQPAISEVVKRLNSSGEARL